MFDVDMTDHEQDGTNNPICAILKAVEMLRGDARFPKEISLCCDGEIREVFLS
jgi:hypothetical protein